MDSLLIAIIQIDIAILGLMAIVLIYRLQALEHRKQMVIDFLKGKYPYTVNDIIQMTNCKDMEVKHKILKKYDEIGGKNSILYIDFLVLAVTPDIKKKIFEKLRTPALILLFNMFFIFTYLSNFNYQKIIDAMYFLKIDDLLPEMFHGVVNIILPEYDEIAIMVMILWFLLGIAILFIRVDMIFREKYDKRIKSDYKRNP